MSNVLGFVALACASMTYGYRAFTCLRAAGSRGGTAQKDSRIRIGLSISAALATTVAIAFLSLLVVPLGQVNLVCVVLVLGILLELANSTLWHRYGNRHRPPS